MNSTSPHGPEAFLNCYDPVVSIATTFVRYGQFGSRFGFPNFHKNSFLRILHLISRNSFKNPDPFYSCDPLMNLSSPSSKNELFLRAWQPPINRPIFITPHGTRRKNPRNWKNRKGYKEYERITSPCVLLENMYRNISFQTLYERKVQ